jgi:hypothetical protein
VYFFPLLAAGLLLGHYPVANHAHCIINGFLMFACAIVFMFTLAAIAWDRYLYVAWRPYYEKYFSRRVSMVVCLAAWLVAGAVCVPSAVDGTIGFDTKTFMCFLESRGVFTTGHAVTIATVVVTLFAVGLPNLLIYRTYAKMRMRVGISINVAALATTDLTSGPSDLRQRFNGTNNNINQPRQQLSTSDIVLFRSLLTIFMAFFVLTAPATIVFIIRNTVYINLFLYGIFIWLYALNNSINWIIYGLMNLRFREGYQCQGLFLDHSIKMCWDLC